MRYFVEVAPVTGETLLVSIEPDDPDAPILTLGADGAWAEDPAFDESLNPRVREVDEATATAAAACFGWTAPIKAAGLSRSA